MSLFGPSRQQQHLDELQAERDRLRLEAEAVRAELERFRHESEALEVDRNMLLATAGRAQAGLNPGGVGELVADIAIPSLGLASFFLALVDRDQDLLTFPYYFEAGKPRKIGSRKFSDHPGVTGRVLQRGSPLYTRNLDEAMALGAVLTQAEKASGIVPQTWYGLPLGTSSTSVGVMAFEHFEVDAFSEARRQTLDALGRMANLMLAASGTRGFR